MHIAKILPICLILAVGPWVLVACQSSPPAAEARQQGLKDTQITSLKQEGFQETEEGWEFNASDKVLFGSNEAVLEPGARQAVERIGRVLVAMQIRRVRVDGHTDDVGSALYNEQLSLRRAGAVADTLIGVGLPTEGVVVRGQGKAKPIASNRTAEGRAQNRRVAIVITSD